MKTQIIVAMILLMPALSLAQAQQGCSGSSICDLILDPITGEKTLMNCAPCGSTSVKCEIGSASLPNSCKEDEFTLTAQCVKSAPKCGQLDFTVPTILLNFDVFRNKDFIITSTPESFNARPGETVVYNINMSNLNPVAVRILINAEAPAGWSVNAPSSMTFNPRETKAFPVTVASSNSSGEGSYNIILTASNPSVSTVSAVLGYTVTSSRLPTVTIVPKSQEGVPGQELTYNVTVLNNDPQGFPASDFVIDAFPPHGWTFRAEPRSVRISPGSSRSFMLKVTSNRTSVPTNTIKINVSSAFSTVQDSVNYVVVLCGDNICQEGEENSCSIDCSSPNFQCAGRCERKTDTGVSFATTVSGISPANFIVCNKGFRTDACKTAAEKNECGIEKACLCSSRFDTLCGLRCVDTDGAYYMHAENAFGEQVRSANYSFSCPFVNLQEIISTKLSFLGSIDSYEMSRSVMLERINSARNNTERASVQPCYDGLGQILTEIRDHVSYLDKVIAFPAVSNTTEARSRTTQLRSEINSIYNSFCSGSTGLVEIKEVHVPANVELGNEAPVSVKVENSGNINYFAYIRCDYTDPNGANLTKATECKQVPSRQNQAYNMNIILDKQGSWNIQCKAFGSLDDQCITAQQHSSSQLIQINSYTRDTFVSSVSGNFIDGKAICSVSTNNPIADCTRCDIAGNSCDFTEKINNTFMFTCPVPVSGIYNVTGSIYPTLNCNPIEPLRKSATLRIPGHGDGIIDEGEQCELPNTANNTNCLQTDKICDGLLTGKRSRYGFCTPNSQCSSDDFVLSCQGPKSASPSCGAECSDGETRLVKKNVTVNGIVQSCECREQCGFSCTFNECACDPSIPAVSPGNSKVVIDKWRCDYNGITRRFEVMVIGNWSGASYAKIQIDNSTSQAMTVSPISYKSDVAGPGNKPVKIMVYNQRNELLRETDVKQAVCQSNRTVSDEVNVQHLVPASTNPGKLNVTMRVSSGLPVQKFVLTELISEGLTVTRQPAVRGATLQSQPGVSVVANSQKFVKYEWTGNIPEGDFNITYEIEARNKAVYNFTAEAHFNGQKKTFAAIMKVTDCMSTRQIVYGMKNGECKQINLNECEAEERGYTGFGCKPSIVEPEPEIPAETGSDWSIVIILIIAGIIAIIAYFKRDDIREKIGSWRSGSE